MANPPPPSLRPVLDRARHALSRAKCTVGPEPTPGQQATLGVVRLAYRPAEALAWALEQGNKPTAMTAVQALANAEGALAYLGNPPHEAPYRACAFLLAAPERFMRVIAVASRDEGRPGGAPDALGLSVYEAERRRLLDTMTRLPGEAIGRPDPPPVAESDGGRRSTHARHPPYARVFEMAAGYMIPDGFAAVDVERFPERDAEDLDVVGEALLSACVDALVTKFPDVEIAEDGAEHAQGGPLGRGRGNGGGLHA